MRNWAGNVTFGADEVLHPTSVEDVQLAVAGRRHVRAIGTGHSFNHLADTVGSMVSLDRLPPVVEVDRNNRCVLVSAGLRYGDIGPALREAGLALPNTGSLPHISIAGATATATHGSGAGNQTLAASVRGLTLVTAEGDVLTVDRRTRPDDFDGFVVSLGRLGVVVSLVLDLVPSFEVAQTVVEDVDEEILRHDLTDVLAAAYSVSVFTDWSGQGGTRVWVKERVGRRSAWSGAPVWGGRLADGPRHPVPGMSAENATVQMGDPGPWDERLPHFRLDHVPSSGDELQSEYFVAARDAQAAWDAIGALHTRLSPVLQISEVRAVAADPFWLSPTRGEATVAFHFTWIPDAEAVGPVVAALESRLMELDARPHWGKVFGTSAHRLHALYPRLADFAGLVGAVDPEGKFGNDLVDGWIGVR